MLPILPPDAPLRERLLWAGISVIIGLVHDGPDLATDQRRFQRIKAACRSFNLYGPDVDRLARHFGFYYHRGSDCYVDRETWEEMTLQDARHTPGTHLH